MLLPTDNLCTCTDYVCFSKFETTVNRFILHMSAFWQGFGVLLAYGFSPTHV